MGCQQIGGVILNKSATKGKNYHCDSEKICAWLSGLCGQQANFFDLLADLLTAGFSHPKQALQSLKVFLPKNGLATVIAELETGQSFSQALRSKVTN